ncbi:MAG: acyl carrier protein [Candidatus Staskawiczbacteria bacterium]|nr:acyl carrier protein [Candidatus Staskawiczbacteria bacterium]
MADGEQNTKSVFERVKELIVQQLSEIVRDRVKLEAKIEKDLLADSLELVELVMACEEEFGIEIPDDDADKLVTVGDAVTYIEQHLPR